MESPRTRRMSTRSLTIAPRYRDDELRPVFERYCSFGTSEQGDQLDSFRMGKLARETGIIGSFVKAPGDIDVLFSTVHRRLMAAFVILAAAV